VNVLWNVKEAVVDACDGVNRRLQRRLYNFIAAIITAMMAAHVGVFAPGAKLLMRDIYIPPLWVGAVLGAVWFAIMVWEGAHRKLRTFMAITAAAFSLVVLGISPDNDAATFIVEGLHDVVMVSFITDDGEWNSAKAAMIVFAMLAFAFTTLQGLVAWVGGQREQRNAVAETTQLGAVPPRRRT
jgi:amino acid transporter